jgi:hypothetical protein
MMPRLSDLLKDWSLRVWESDDGDIFLGHDEIQYLGRKIYDDYEPAQFDVFEDRLDLWLHNVSNEKDQQDLFRLLCRLFFVGRSEFEALCRAAHHGPVLRWLIEQLSVNIADPEAAKHLNAGIAETWFCPMTDSMRINSYFKVNNLPGRSHQPDWRSLRKFGNPDQIRQFIGANAIKRLVLLEDFVGSGTQMKSVVKFAAELDPNFAILACPLIICPDGDEVGSELITAFPNVAFDPVLRISPEMLIKPTAQPDEPPIFGAIRALTTTVRSRLSPPSPDEGTYHGYKATGAVFAMYSNCPNNSLPILRDRTSDWSPLFPRIKRS